MNQNTISRKAVTGSVILLALVVLALIVVPRESAAEFLQTGAVQPPGGSLDRAATPFDYETSADNMAARWVAMGAFYEREGLLTRDDFDHEQAAEVMAARWTAMGAYYEKEGLLTRDDFDYDQAADDLAARWAAMGKYYEAQGLLNSKKS